MKWHELADNPLAIAGIYHEVPALQEVSLHQVIFSRDGPFLTLVTALPAPPDNVPPRWKLTGASADTLDLSFEGYISLKFRAGVAHSPVTIQIMKVEPVGLSLEVLAPNFLLRAVAGSFRITVLKNKR